MITSSNCDLLIPPNTHKEPQPPPPYFSTQENLPFLSLSEKFDDSDLKKTRLGIKSQILDPAYPPKKVLASVPSDPMKKKLIIKHQNEQLPSQKIVLKKILKIN